MLERVKCDIGTKVRTKIHYMNDPRSEVDAVICGIEIDGEKNTIKYKIHIEPTKDDMEMGCTGRIGYVDQDDIICLYK